MYKMRRSITIGKSLEKKINQILLILILIFLLPLFITTLSSRLRIEELVLNFSGSKNVQVETVLPGIVAKQIGISMPEECIKAQAVIARTNFYAAEKNHQSEQEYFDEAKLRELWGEQYEEYYEKLQKLITETAGETLQYNGEYIYAAYHQISAGNTRTMAEYAGSGKMPYLYSVPCHEDVTAEDYLKVYFWPTEEYLQLLRTLFPEEVINSTADIWVVARDSAGYALQVQVGQTVYDGEEFRKRLSLSSACLEFTTLEDGVRIVTMGSGHGFGLSQNTAKKMADAGSDYKEILKYFYKGTVLTE